MKNETRPLVLHVIHHLVTGGMENGLVNLINHLPENRFRHAVACVEDFSDFRLRLTRSDTPVIALHRSRVGVWRLRQGLFRLCRQLQPTIVHSRNQSGLDALLPARLAGVPHCIHGEHGWDVDDLAGRRVKPALLRRLHSPLVDRYITVSAELRNYLVERVGISPGRVTQIINGVDAVRYAPATHAERWQSLPAGFAGPGCVLIGTVGRLQPVKDQATLLRAFARLAKDGDEHASRARLVIVGDGPSGESLRRLAAELGVSSLIWFPGAVSNVRELLQAFDVFVLPSLAEGISNTLLEAMATGLPLLATATGGNVELVADEISGRLFQPRDVAGLSDLLRQYLVDPHRRQRHGSAAREIALARFSLATMLANYQAVYEEFCDRHRPVPATLVSRQSNCGAGRADGG
ncbi:MAG TPA: TIGR03088 family PEP-CTERM/XrtA system glycosyltransferase [Candidatus Accumulibacter phosphatis]|nr:MAG: putative glycosyltransferase EpsF [Candidatus Accumulibacter sp. SK-11]HAY29395.1 sugar transferase [Accumulibacter sp.]HCN68369.1 TIGR03088 family PEP-CTERM/XrtA system glycosyltransferase [Accumulibacter sp.]HRL75736.1 TIGR03088 family PEP-CTERM/XrtA system glycosyltransferase [Candidatus Accumulibacter phosphatis]HRQ93956.1 TIGR03088 family PEP-CTERM/XrtA system glycosyltransferase [Candidatus Accumulibacter phosphatis]